MTNEMDSELKGEATYVITNAITCSDEDHLLEFTDAAGPELINSLCRLMRELNELNFHRHLIEVMSAIDRIAGLDDRCRS